MSAVIPTPPYDPLGLDAPFAQGDEQADRQEAGPAWNEQVESPYAEAAECAGAGEDLEHPGAGDEDLAWLDVEAKDGGSQVFFEDYAVDGEGLAEPEYAEYGEYGKYGEPGHEWQRDASAGEGEYLDEGRDANEAGAQPTLKRATVAGFGRYRSDAAALAPPELAKIAALAKYVLWSFGPGRTPVRTIELTGHADRDAARGAAFEMAMSRDRALQMRAVLADAIDRRSAARQPGDPPWPPFSARLHWNIVPRGARALLVANPRTEPERARNRRVDIALHAADATPVRGLAFEAESEHASIEWTFPVMLRFSKVVPAAINATNCCRAVQTAGRLFEAANPPKSPCGTFNFFGSQLIAARDYQAPLSATRKCCQWTDAYWRQCRSDPHRSGCAHCGDVPGPHLVLKYARQALNDAVGRIKQALDRGCTVAAGVLSGICDDKPDIGCARVAGADAWRQCPEHWVLILAYNGNTFLFWDSSQASAMQTRDGHRFGLFEYDAEAPRLSTARSAAGADRMVVDASGFHTRGYPASNSQKRFQVLDLRNSAPCPAWEANRQCGEYDNDGRFAQRACPLPGTLRENDGENYGEEHGAPEAEFFDDEERDAAESGGRIPQAEWFEPEDEADGAARTPAPLPDRQRQWVLALERSALDRLPDQAQRTRFLQQDWSDVEFPGNVPRGQSATAVIQRHWALARDLFGAMAGVVSERRVPKTIRFRERPTRPVPGQPRQRLFGEACDAFVRMREAARQDGVELFILSSWRSRARQAAASANQPNPNAVARQASAHMYGLAIDLRMGVPGLPIAEINTRVDRATAAKAGTAAKMGNLVRMYRSPVYKWMSLRAREFGWYPYRNEPWHWEYNPPGLKARFEGGARQESAAAEDHVDEEALEGEAQCPCRHDEAVSPSLLRTFTARALGVKVAILVTQAARSARQVEMLVFAHGLDLCRPVRKNRPATFITDPPFDLGRLVEASGRPIVLLVPFLDWEHMEANGMAFGKKWHRLAQPDVFNAVAAEALEQLRALTGRASAPALRRLILAGHSRAYGFFDALAHASGSPQMRSGALGRPLHVWALDTTYSAPIADWRAWLQSRDDLQATVVYRHGAYKPRGSSVARELTTGLRGRQFGELAARSQGRLTVMPVAAGKVSHCAIPNAYLPRLLAALPSPDTGESEAGSEADAEEFDGEEGEDLAGLEAEAEAQALAAGDEAAGEAEGAPGRFDAFGDERDAEWSSESSEELESRDEVDGGHEQPLSFESEEQEREQEGGLAGSGLTPAEQKAVEITSLFETGRRGGFYGLSGNFDGQGLSFGLVNWTIGTGSLQPLLRDFAREHPARWAWVFGADASRFLQLMSRKGEEARKEQHRFAVEQMNTVSTGAHGKRIWTVRQPWVGYFRRLSEDRAFQQIQVRHVRDLLVAAAGYCRRFRFTSEQAFCFMFDAVASHGKGWLRKKFGGVEKRRELIERAFKALAARSGTAPVPESEALLAIADALAATSAQRWADQVRRRKRWFVTGQHPRERELLGLRPRPDIPYATSGAGAGEWEAVDQPYGEGGSGSAGSRDEYEGYDDAREDIRNQNAVP